MNDIEKILNFSNLFIAIAGLLFSVWFSEINTTINMKKEPIYRNRLDYISKTLSTIFAKCIPLNSFLLAYLITLCSPAISILQSNSFTINPYRIDPAPTMFMMTYLISLYFLVISIYQLFLLIRNWWKAGEGHSPPNPRITMFR